MKFKNFLKDKLFACGVFGILWGIVLLLFVAFKISVSLMIVTSAILVTGFVIVLIFEFWRRRKFYNALLKNIQNLDQAYLVLETLSEPNFYEGKLVCQALYAINKSMTENVNQARVQSQDFREYIEMWVHEVKAPLATLELISNRSHAKDQAKIQMELARLEDALEQVLYYARSENAEKDYLITEVNLAEVVKNVGVKNMNTLLASKVDFEVGRLDYTVMSDAKWLEFILAQIVNNSIKYRRKRVKSYIKISAKREGDLVKLEILDNGIGIQAADLKQVFDKSFTGRNGRKIAHSTGMGLYIAKQMCEKLGHQIAIESAENEYTKVTLAMSDNRFFEVV